MVDFLIICTLNLISSALNLLKQNAIIVINNLIPHLLFLITCASGENAFLSITAPSVITTNKSLIITPFNHGNQYMKLEKQMKHKGFTISESCLNCGFFDSSKKQQYRCKTLQCPSHLNYIDKQFVIKNWNPTDIPIKELSDIIKDTDSKNAEYISDQIDKEILQQIKQI